MIRLLQLLILIAVAVIVWRLVRRALAAPAARSGAAPTFEPTGRCEKCGTHVPRTELDRAGICPRCLAQGPRSA